MSGAICHQTVCVRVRVRVVVCGIYNWGQSIEGNTHTSINEATFHARIY